MKYSVKANVTSAQGMMVSKYAGATGTATIDVTDAYGALAKGTGRIYARVSSLDIRMADGSKVDLSALGSALDADYPADISGFSARIDIPSSVADITLSIAFAGREPGKIPAKVSAVLTAKGGWLTRVACKLVEVKFDGALTKD